MDEIELEKLKKKYIISDEDKNHLIREILNEITYKKEKKINYCNFIIGVPASGKSTISDFLIQQDGDLVRLNGDFIRSKYPNYNEISSLYPTEVFLILKEEMIYIKNEIMSYLIKKGYAFNREYSLNYIDNTIDLTKKSYNFGYTINYYIVYTGYLELHLRAVERFFNQLQNGKSPRIIDIKHQDYAIQQMQKLINRLDIDLISNIKIVDTTGNIYDIKKEEIKHKKIFEQLNRKYKKSINKENIVNRIRTIENYMDFYKDSLNENVIQRLNDHMVIIKKELNSK